MTEETKKTALITAAVAVAILVVWLLSGGTKMSPNGGSGAKNDLSKPSEKERVVRQEAAVSITAFPSGFPVGAGAAGSGFKYVPANSTEQQSTLEYVSAKSLKENETIFKDYLAASSFKIVNKLEDSKSAFYYATKDNNDLSIRIAQSDGQVTVTASYLKR